MRLILRQLALACVLMLSACVTQAPQPTQPAQAPSAAVLHQARLKTIQGFSLKGRLGVVTQKQGFSGGIAWQHQLLNDDIQVFSPLGGKVADITKTPQQVTLTDQKGNSISAADAESLTETTLGWRLPLKGLSDWALGRPTNSPILANAWDANGRLIMLKQDGWDIEFPGYNLVNDIALPSRVYLKSEKVNLKLIVETWQPQ